MGTDKFAAHSRLREQRILWKDRAIKIISQFYHYALFLLLRFFFFVRMVVFVFRRTIKITAMTVGNLMLFVLLRFHPLIRFTCVFKGLAINQFVAVCRSSLCCCVFRFSFFALFVILPYRCVCSLQHAQIFENKVEVRKTQIRWCSFFISFVFHSLKYFSVLCCCWSPVCCALGLFLSIFALSFALYGIQRIFLRQLKKTNENKITNKI